MTKKNEKGTAKSNVFSTLWRWLKRTFFGGSRELLSDDAGFAVESLDSPSVMAMKTFFRRKLAVTALVVLIALFLFVFIGPNFFPMDLTYTDPLQANMAPNYTVSWQAMCGPLTASLILRWVSAMTISSISGVTPITS